jgi:hypothetical protein
LDHDNLVGGLKPVIDGLRWLQLIHDDDADSLALDVKTEHAKHGKTRLVLEVWN